MQINALYKALGLTLGALLVAACSSTGEINEGESSETVTKAEEVTTEVTEAVEETSTTAVDTSAVSGESLESRMTEAEAALLEQTVFYFDFDQSTIKSDSKAALKVHAAYLAANSSARVVLEGHADERGTVEYNLALGERRAMAVRRFLLANGASASQLEVVSFGEERPVVMGHSESSWAKNRRVEVKYQSR
ncbi:MULTISPECIES: peptidoglycan-associated lipoprotein Pal [Oceanospirillaceae]|jgi:peptidoglycan-associated lipoprotein|uniref:Peptidoglycan-associated protein n=1 Tax=Oceanobacter antarcticus TaxID=3133425 RepID=A0ABW8NKW2_9GAMM|tara:strand:+ start:21319 stop:21894 length:576 start_codon:yes stop_codon:yes gene_type:complete